jgi:hypothetical protein
MRRLLMPWLPRLANALGGVALVLLPIDPTRDLRPVLGLLGAAVGLLVLEVVLERRWR